MKKEFQKLARYFENRKATIQEQFKNELTPQQIQNLSAESASVDEILQMIKDMPDMPDNPEVSALKQKVTDLEAALSENQADFENKIAKMVEGKTQKQFVNFVKEAVELKVFENKETGKAIAKTYFKNANNANVNVVYNDSEVGVVPSLVSSLIDYVRQININGENSIAWNEVDGTTDAAAIVAIGAAKPIRTNTHVTHTAAGDTLAVIAKLPNQYAKAISMLADIYMNDLSKDLYRKLNATVIELLADGGDLSDLVSVPKVKTPQLIDVIRAVASGIKTLFPENRVVIGLSQSALFALDSVKDENGNYIQYDFNAKGIDLVAVPVVGSFGETSIIGMSENVVRWYNDGIVNKTSDQAYWANNQMGLMSEILNSVFVLRGSDAKATVFDDWSTIITSMTPA